MDDASTTWRRIFRIKAVMYEVGASLHGIDQHELRLYKPRYGHGKLKS